MNAWIRRTCFTALALWTIVPPADAPAQIVTLQTLRGSAGFGYERFAYDMEELPAGAYDDRQVSPLGTLQMALAILDPGILLIDGYGDFRFDRLQRSSSTVDLDTRSRFRDLRLGMTVLAARGAPLRLFYSRAANRTNQDQRLHAPDGVNRMLSLLGSHASKGFTWQLAGRGRRPEVNAMGSITNRHDEGDFASSGELRSRERNLELRAGRAGERGRYEVSYLHRGIRQQFPLHGLESAWDTDLLRAQTTVKPAERLTIDLGGHYSSHTTDRLNGGQQSRALQGGGGDAGLTWTWSPRWSVLGTYSYSSNVVEVALAGASLPEEVPPGGLPIDLPVSSRENVNYQDATMALRFTARSGRTTATVGPRVLVLDPIWAGIPTLDRLHTIQTSVDHQFRAVGLDVTTGASAAAGRAISDVGDRDPYHESSARLRLSRRIGAGQIGADGSVGDSQGPWFYPVGGQSWRAGMDVSTGLPAWARLRAGFSHSRLLRDTVLQEGIDYTRMYTAGLSGGRYDVSFEHSEVRSTATGLQDTALLAVLRPDVIAATRRDLFGLLYGTEQRSSTLQARVRILNGLELNARGLNDRRVYPGIYRLEQRGGRVSLIWTVGTTQLDAGVESYELQWSLGLTRNQRVYVRVVRNFTVF
ncbi:MAG TPA: hypothetical protein VK886_14140 [Vicinamibacterales bacterium]|nr:hypothetical protein [Vicinamibacterales bacterium]